MSPATLNQLSLALDDRLDWLSLEREHHPIHTKEWGHITEQMDECEEAHREVARLCLPPTPAPCSECAGLGVTVGFLGNKPIYSFKCRTCGGAS